MTNRDEPTPADDRECPICALHELGQTLFRGAGYKVVPALAFLLPMRGLPPLCPPHAKRGRAWLKTNYDLYAEAELPLLPGEAGWDHKANPLCERRWDSFSKKAECVLPESHAGGCKGYLVGSFRIERVDAWSRKWRDPREGTA